MQVLVIRIRSYKIGISLCVVTRQIGEKHADVRFYVYWPVATAFVSHNFLRQMECLMVIITDVNSVAREEISVQLE